MIRSFATLFLLILCSASTLVYGQAVDLGLDHQTNAIVQFSAASDGTLWCITSSSMDRLPTLAGVHSVRSTNGGSTWEGTVITEDWWRWGIDIAPASKDQAWAVVMRDDVIDTIDCYRTTNAGKVWHYVSPADVQLTQVNLVHFISPTNGYLFGVVGGSHTRKWMVVHTTDGGKTFTRVDSMLARIGETLFERNKRSVGLRGDEIWIGLSSGRIIIIDGKNNAARDVMAPLGGGISGIAQLSDGSMLVTRTKNDGSVSAMKTKDGSSWDPVDLPAAVRNVHGFYAQPSGSILTIPSDVTLTPLVEISADLAKAAQRADHHRFGCIITSKGVILTGTELLPGGGMFRVSK